MYFLLYNPPIFHTRVHKHTHIHTHTEDNDDRVLTFTYNYVKNTVPCAKVFFKMCVFMYLILVDINEKI